MVDGAANDKEIFRRSTMNRIASADELDHYIKVTNPSAWVITLAALLLIVGVIVWAVVAIVPVTVNTTGILLEDPQSTDMVAVCMVDKSTADKIQKMGAKVNVGDVEALGVEVGRTPASSSEIIDFLGSKFYADAISLSDWNYIATIALDEEPSHSDYIIETSAGEAYPVPISIVVYETQPINIVLGKA